MTMEDQKRVDPPRMTELITDSTFHRTVNGVELTMLRNMRGLTQSQLAAMVAQEMGIASLSKQFICQLESPGEYNFEHEIRIEIAGALLKILEVK